MRGVSARSNRITNISVFRSDFWIWIKFKMIYKMNLRLEDAIDQMEDLAGDSKELSDMVNFLRNVTRGILR